MVGKRCISENTGLAPRNNDDEPTFEEQESLLWVREIAQGVECMPGMPRVLFQSLVPRGLLCAMGWNPGVALQNIQTTKSACSVSNRTPRTHNHLEGYRSSEAKLWSVLISQILDENMYLSATGTKMATRLAQSAGAEPVLPCHRPLHDSTPQTP